MMREDQLIAEEFFRVDAGGGCETVIRAGAVGYEIIGEGGDRIENGKGVDGPAGRHHVAFIGAEIDHGLVLNHIGDADQLFQLGIEVFLHLGKKAGVAVRDFPAEAVRENGIGQEKHKRHGQNEHERIGNNIAVKNSASAFHLPFRSRERIGNIISSPSGKRQ